MTEETRSPAWKEPCGAVAYTWMALLPINNSWNEKALSIVQKLESFREKVDNVSCNKAFLT
jgi:hypothetical protein